MGDAYVYAEDDEGGYPIPELPDRDETISKMWSVYLERAKKVDMETIDEFKGEADGILIFTGLFSATIATFLVDSYKALQPDPNAEMVLYLAQIAAQLDGTSPSSLPQPPPFRPSAVSVRVNILWFISLCLSLAVALTAVMIQSWCRRYTQLSQRSQPVPGLQARIRVFLFDGMERYRMEDLVGVMPSILHAAVLLFLIGIVDFLFPINATVAASVLVFVVLIAAYLVALTLSPLARLESPYSTPFSWILWRVLSFLSSIAHLEIPKLPSTRHDPVEGDPRVPPRRRFYLGPRSTVVHTLAQQQSVRSAEIRALFSAVDTSPPLSPPDAVAFLDGLAFSLEPPAVPPFPDDNSASASAAAVLSAGHACLHSISRTLLPRATHVRPFLRLCYALQRATINTDRSLVRETLFPLYVRPCMSPALERALEQQPLGPEPHVAVMARVLLAHHVLAELDVRVRFGSPHTRGHHHPPPPPPPHHSLMPVPTSDSGGGGGGGGLSTVLTIIEDVLELNQWTTTEQLMVCGVMIEDCVRAATRARLDPTDADGAQAVFLRVRAAAARLAEEREGQVSFVELGRQLKKLEAMLGVDGGGGGGAKDGKCAEQVVKIEKFHRHLS